MNRVKELRTARGYMQKDIAERVGCSPAVMSMYEHGQRKLPVKIARKLATIYGCPWYELYEDEDNGKTAVG